MKITICGSIAFHDEMLAVKQDLESFGHEVKVPSIKVADEDGALIPAKEFKKTKEKNLDQEWVRNRVHELILRHYKKIEWSDAILVVNYDKNGIAGYVGGNTLMEMGLALYLKKKIYLLNKIPKLGYSEEILAMQPVVVSGDLRRLKGNGD